MSIASESYSDDQAAVAVICDSGLMIDLQAQDKPQVPVRRAMSTTVDIPQSVINSLRDFGRSRRNAKQAAAVYKVNKAKLVVEEVGEPKEISIEDLVDELPENHPRIIVLSYEYQHKDGRRTFPLVLVNWIPKTAEMGLLTVHATTILRFQEEARVSKVVEVREPDDFTREAVDKVLSAY